MTNAYRFGAVYILEQDYTDAEIERDLKNMADCGYNLVTFWPVANPWLVKSSHEWNFDVTKKALDLCQKFGMQAILQLFGQNQAHEFMPDAALTQEMEVHDENGEIVNENCHWANVNHPVVREYFDLYFRAAMNALAKHPALFAWDVFNEAHFRSDDPWTVALYQEWLKRKYGSIEKLNRDWYRRYESFSQVRPIKRHSAYSIWSSLLPELDYEKFRSVNLTDFCAFLYETAKKYDSVHPVIIDGTSSQIIAPQVILRNNDEFASARIPDIYGATFYPKSWGTNYKENPWTASLYFSIPAWAAHKAGKPYYVNEIQTHTQSALTPGSEVSGFELCAWILMCMFTSASGIQLWRWRPFLHGYQVTGRGLTRLDGSPNERSKAVASLLSQIHNTTLFTSFRPTASAVKIVIGYDVRLYFDSLLKWKDSFWAKDVEGWYRYFWQRGLAIGFANLHELDDDDMRTPVLVLPAAIRVSEAEAQKLLRYVEDGGILLADGRLATLNEKAEAPANGIPGKTLSTLFGIRELDVASDDCFSLDGNFVAAPYMHQILETFDNAQTLSVMEKDKSPAIVSHEFGRGKTLYFNSFIGLGMFDGVDQAIAKLLTAQLPLANSVQFSRNDAGKARVHSAHIENDTEKALLLINFGNERQEVLISGIGVGKNLRDIFANTSMTSEESTKFTLKPEEFRVISWEK
jgi:beta-galactosidase